MKLLFDENLSPVLPAALSDCYSDAQHVREVGLKASPDGDVWTYAARNELAIQEAIAALGVGHLLMRQPANEP